MYLKLNGNKIATYQNLCDTAEAVLKMKLTELNACVSKEERPKIKKLIFSLKKLGKEEQFNTRHVE